MIEISETVLSLLPWIILVVGAVATFASKWGSASDAEHEELSRLKAERITLLETRVGELETKLSELTGAYEALHALKSGEIAAAVVEALIHQAETPARVIIEPHG